MENRQSYLRHFVVTNWKSIIQADISFKPGMNIIIGKNGSGKTNLLEAIHNIINPTEDFLSGNSTFQASAEWNLPEHNHQVTIQIRPVDQAAFNEIEDDQIAFNNPLLRFILNSSPDLFSYQTRLLEFSASSLFFRFPSEYQISFLNQFNSGWVITKDFVSVENETSKSWEGTFPGLHNSIRRSLDREASRLFQNPDAISSLIISLMNDFRDGCISVIKRFSPVSDIRVVPGQVISGYRPNSHLAKGFFFEFEIQGQYHAFDNLSDGTKRILVILFELHNSYRFQIMSKYQSEISLLEEPEVGIHPHQLHLLLSFLRERASSGQIIITTHSPQVLDVLNEDQLDRIIIAENSGSQGNRFRHLTEKEIKKAKKYMVHDQLSDYWRYSDLEPI